MTRTDFSHHGTRLVEFVERSTRDAYEVLAGLRDEPRAEVIQREYLDVFRRENVLELEARLGAGKEPRRRRSLELMRLETAHGVVQSRIRGRMDEVSAWRARTEISVGGERVPWESLPSRIRDTSEREARRTLEEARREAARPILATVREAWELAYEAVAQLGFRSYAEAYARWKALPLEHIAELARTGLARTDDGYARELDRYARRVVGCSGSAARHWDVPRLVRGAEWDARFPGAGVAETLRRVAAWAGVDVERATGLVLDLEPRATKSARPFCAGIKVPGEVALVARPSGGHRDYEEVLHELGHALHFHWTDPTLPGELRAILDDTVAETHAFLLGGLLRSVEFLVDGLQLSTDDAAEYARYARFIELCTFRRYCAKTLFELELHASGNLGRAAALHARHLGDALGFDVPGETALLETDSGLYAAQYLLAWALEGMLRERLQGRHGPYWFRSPDAAAELRAEWSLGQSESYEERMRAWGTTWSVEPLLRGLASGAEAR